MFSGSIRKKSLRSYLLALALACLLPVTVVSGFGVWKAGTAYRDTATSRLNDTARTIANAVESELEGRFAMLSVLAAAWSDLSGAKSSSSPISNFGNLGLPGEVAIVAIGKDGEKPDFPRTGSFTELAREAVERNVPLVSDISMENRGNEPRIFLALPATGDRRGRAAFMLSASPTELVRTLQQRGEALSGILVAVTDGTGHIVARSRDPERFMGKLVPDWAKLQAMGTDHGLFEAVTTEGSPIAFSFQKLRGTPGWVVVVGEPMEIFNARWREPLEGLALGAVIAVMAALAAAIWISRLILRPVTALAAHSKAIVEAGSADRPVSVPPSPIREFETLRQSFEAAEKALRERAEAERRIVEALAESELRYRTVAEVGTLVFWRRDASGTVLSATGWEELTGMPESEALGLGWFDAVHPDDRMPVTIAWQEAVVTQSAVDLEFRVSDRNGRWRWVRARGAAVVDGRGAPKEWAGALEDIDARRQAQERIHHMAHHDALTGLGNRILLREKLEQAVARAGRGEHSALLYIDLDRFKDVNDLLGHPVGDALLCAVASRLRDCTRETDFVARLGGDEFSIIQSGSTQPNAASDLASRIIETLSAPYDLDGQQVVIGASVGIAVVVDADKSANNHLRNADLALYRAKEDGRGRFCFFELDMDVRMQERHRQEIDLRRGLADGEFEVFYQPLVDLRSGTVIGFEALLRWKHPQRGLLDAAEFLPLAEDIGVIALLGQKVLMHACAEARKWPENLKVAVNISAAQLASRHLAAGVQTALRESGLAPQRLALEITESALIETIETAMATLLRLKMLGVTITLDDFGTGCSSLGYLRSFPFDKVKIHNSFVRDLGQQKECDAVVRAVAGLCSSLGITAAAEGVETEEQRQFLGREQCIEAQGYLFGRPCSSTDIPSMLAAFSDASAVSQLDARRIRL